MALPLYLAFTREEMAAETENYPFFAFLGCSFSPGGTGLAGAPDDLPPGAMLILDDSTPFSGQDPERVRKELSSLMEKHRCGSLLLDFQRPGCQELKSLARAIVLDSSWPVAVSAAYAEGLPCPVFLDPAPPDKPLQAHLTPWQGREIWLDAARNTLELTLTAQGCTASPLLEFPNTGLQDAKLHCHYHIDLKDFARFRLWRTKEDLEDLLQEVESLGVTRAVGLLQELGKFECTL